jgi:hypothetical protein
MKREPISKSVSFFEEVTGGRMQTGAPWLDPHFNFYLWDLEGHSNRNCINKGNRGQLPNPSMCLINIGSTVIMCLDLDTALSLIHVN